MIAAEIILLLTGAYLGVGIIFAMVFAVRGVEAIDAAARGASVGFRLLIIPGAAALWPLLAVRWATAGRARRSP